MFRPLPLRMGDDAMPTLSGEEWAAMTAGATILVVRRDGSPRSVLSTTGRIVKQESSAPCGGRLDREPR